MGDGSVGKVLILQLEVPEFKLQIPHTNSCHSGAHLSSHFWGGGDKKILRVASWPE